VSSESSKCDHVRRVWWESIGRLQFIMLLEGRGGGFCMCWSQYRFSLLLWMSFVLLDGSHKGLAGGGGGGGGGKGGAVLGVFGGAGFKL